MIYRVIFKVGYNNAWFDFCTIEEAGKFAYDVLTHQVENEDTKKRNSVRIDVIVDADAEEEE